MKYQIYYCVDVNLWYIDKDDGEERLSHNPFDTENDAVNFFLQYSDCFLKDQKECLNDYGQHSTAREDVCWLESRYFAYKINRDKTWTCTRKKSYEFGR